MAAFKAAPWVLPLDARRCDACTNDHASRAQISSSLKQKLCEVPYPTYKYKTYRSLRHRADLFGPERAVQNSPPRGPRRRVEVTPPLGQVLTPGDEIGRSDGPPPVLDEDAGHLGVEPVERPPQRDGHGAERDGFPLSGSPRLLFLSRCRRDLAVNLFRAISPLINWRSRAYGHSIPRVARAAWPC